MTFFILCACQALGILSYEMGRPYLPDLFTQLGISSPELIVKYVGTAQSAVFFLTILTTPYWGRLGDRMGRKAMLVRAHLGLAFSLLVLSLARTPAQVIAAKALQGFLAGVTAAAYAMLADDASGAKIGWIQFSSLLGALIGPFVGAAASSRLGPRAPFLIGGALSCVSGYVAHLTHEEGRPRAAEPGGWEVFSTMWPVMLTAVYLFTWRSLDDTILPVFVAAAVPGKAAAWWIAWACGASRLGAMMFGPWWGRHYDKIGPVRVLRIVTPVAAVLVALQLVATRPAMLIAIRALLGIFLAPLTGAAFALAAKRTDATRRGEAMALLATGGRLGDGLGATGAAVLVSGLGLRGLYVVMAIGLAGSLLILKQSLEAPSEEEPAIDSLPIEELQPLSS